MYRSHISKFINIIGKIKNYLGNQKTTYDIHSKKGSEKYLFQKFERISSFKKFLCRYVNYGTLYRSIKYGISIIIIATTYIYTLYKTLISMILQETKKHSS